MPAQTPPSTNTKRRTHRFTDALSVEHLLQGIPMRNAAVRERLCKDTLTLQLPLRQRWWNRAPLTWLFPVRSHRRFALDVLGRQVWDAIDEETTVEALTESFAAQHKLGFNEARAMVTAFLKMLVQRNLIVLSIEAPEAPQTPDAHNTEPTNANNTDTLHGATA